MLILSITFILDFHVITWLNNFFFNIYFQVYISLDYSFLNVQYNKKKSVLSWYFICDCQQLSWNIFLSRESSFFKYSYLNNKLLINFLYVFVLFIQIAFFVIFDLKL